MFRLRERKKKRKSIIEKLEEEGWIREIEAGNKKLVFVDWFLHYLYLMSLLRDQNLYRRISLRSSNLKKYYKKRIPQVPSGFMLSVVEDFSVGALKGRRAKLMKEAVSLLKSRGIRVILRKTRNRVLLYRFLHSLALRVSEGVFGGGLLKKLRSILPPWGKREKTWKTSVFRLDGFSPPLHRILLL